MTTSPRLRRLQSDYEAVRRLSRLHGRITIDGVYGNPPEKYLLTLRVRSLREQSDEIVAADEHKIEISLPRGYPRDAPLCRMLTPVFHPNVAPHAICIGDHWTAGERLDAMIQRIGEMLAFQSYNVQSPLNGRAAQWVEQHADRLPTDRDEFFKDLSAEPAVEKPAGCANCGAAGEFVGCPVGHALCPDCLLRCPSCGRVLCLKCGESTCTSCAPACANCGAAAVDVCPAGHPACGDCRVFCERCGQRLCLTCGTVPCPICR